VSAGSLRKPINLNHPQCLNNGALLARPGWLIKTEPSAANSVEFAYARFDVTAIEYNVAG
jgi:hypothetical protein